jgi:hypothetical protein
MILNEHRTQLVTLVRSLSNLVESARAGRNLAVKLRDDTDDTDAKSDLHEAAQTCATLGNAARLSLIKIKSYLPQDESDAHHEPISPR